MRYRMKQVIFTADDFGLAPEVNAAVLEAHVNGVLTTASLMIGGPAATGAIAMARIHPGLGIGLHVVVADGDPVLPAPEIPSLVDRHGGLRRDLVAAAFSWFFDSAARAELRREVAAQFDAFRATGLRCDHVNVHNHLHLHPTVLSLVIENAKRLGVRRVRLPYEPSVHASGSWGESLGAALLRPWVWLVRRRLLRAGFVTNDAMVGLGATGHMTEARVLAALARLGEGVTEFYFHPATATTPALEAAAPGYDRAGELAALCSPAVAATIRELGLKRCVFRDLADPAQP